MWSFPSSQNRASIRAGVDQVLKEIFDVYLLIRIDRKFKCANYSEGNADSGICDVSCECYGTGYKVSLEVVPGHMPFGVNVRSLDSYFKDAPGYIKTDRDILIMPWHVFPEVGDLVCSVEWNLPLTSWKAAQFKPTRILECYKISDVERPNVRGGLWHAAGLNPYQSIIQNIQDRIPTMHDLVKKDWN